MENIYLLKDLSRISGHSTHTLKYYLRIGILWEVGRSPETNFRYFDDSTLERIKAIRSLRTQGLTLESITQKLAEQR